MSTLPLAYGLVILGVGLLWGLWDARRLTSLDVVELGRHAPYLYLLIPLSLLALVGDVCLSHDSALQWRLPDWLLVHYVPLSRGLVVLNLAYILTLAGRMTFRAQHPQRWQVMAAGLLSVVASLYFQFQYGRTVQVGPPRRSGEGVILQTDDSTCGAAAAANVATWLGHPVTEADMVALMGTTPLGSSPGQVLYGLQRLGLEAHLVNCPDLRQLHLPAILFVMSRSLGPEAHAVALARFHGPQAELWDPSIGRRYIWPRALYSIWRGHAIEVSLPTSASPTPVATH